MPDRPFLDGLPSLGPTEDVRPLWEQRAAQKWSRPGAWISLGRLAWVVAGLGVILATLRLAVFHGELAAVGPAVMIVIAFLVATSGPIVGCLLQRLCGGSGIKGAVVGGALWCAAVILTYTRAYWSPAPGTFDALGPAITIPLVTAWGSGIGLLTGLTLRTLLGPPAPWRGRSARIPASPRP